MQNHRFDKTGYVSVPTSDSPQVLNPCNRNVKPATAKEDYSIDLDSANASLLNRHTLGTSCNIEGTKSQANALEQVEEVQKSTTFTKHKIIWYSRKNILIAITLLTIIGIALFCINSPFQYFKETGVTREGVSSVANYFLPVPESTSSASNLPEIIDNEFRLPNGMVSHTYTRPRHQVKSHTL